MTKVLWVVDMKSAASQARLLADAKAMKASHICVRSDNATLPAAIGKFHAVGLKVFAWRWPAVTPGPHGAAHYYALDEARYLTTALMPAGLDGYIVDVESDRAGQANDWDSAAHAGLATEFCQTIRAAITLGVPTCAQPFHFGATAGCRQPTNNRHIPWAAFAHACDALYPQAYWRAELAGGPTAINGGTPAAARSKAIAAWTPIAAGKPLRHMAGEIALATAAEITAYGGANAGQGGLHFYTHAAELKPAVMAAIAAL